MRNNEEKAKFDAKRQQEEQRIMAEREKQRKEQEEQSSEAYSTLPERQLQMLLSGRRSICSYCHLRQHAELFTHGADCPITRAVSIEPGLELLEEEFRTGKIIKRVIGQRAYDRFVKFAKPGETWEDCMNRLLDVIVQAQAS